MNLIQNIPIEQTINKICQNIHAQTAIPLKIYKETNLDTILVDARLFEKLLTINLLAASQYQQAKHSLRLIMKDTTLRYNYNPYFKTPTDFPTLQALAFCMSSIFNLPTIQQYYDVQQTFPQQSHLPMKPYQLESKNIINIHGGYMEISNHNHNFAFLYVFPTSITSAMLFKNDDALYVMQIAETADSLQLEKILTIQLLQSTTLRQITIEKTIKLIKRAHGFMLRTSGEPYYTHPMEVVKILLEVTNNPNTILTGFLHDLIEDTPINLQQIKAMYGANVAYLVNMVTRCNHKGHTWYFCKEENKNLLKHCKHIGVIQVKLADRLHNLRTLHVRTLADQKRIAKDTMEYYIPWGKKNKVLTWLPEMYHICHNILKI